MSLLKNLGLCTALLLASFPAHAQAEDPSFAPFVPFGQLQALLDDAVLDDAELFHSERPGAYLLRSSRLEQPLLINVRGQRVERVAADKIRDNGNGTLSLLAGADVTWAGPFEVETSRLVATLSGRQLVLAPKPHLLGARRLAEIVAHDVSYGYRASLYPPSQRAIDALRRETRQVSVRVFFGSWCSTCSRVLPWLMAVEKGLEGGRFTFEYYGLAQPMDDPIAREAGVKLVPTAVVSVDGKELGRRTSTGLGIPEEALLEILAGDGPK